MYKYLPTAQSFSIALARSDIAILQCVGKMNEFGVVLDAALLAACSPGGLAPEPAPAPAPAPAKKAEGKADRDKAGTKTVKNFDKNAKNGASANTPPPSFQTDTYGALASNLPGCGPEKYYLTTAIAYTNGYPHIGHAYEFITADVLVRYHRVLGYDSYFLTGTDEHGQKVANSAEAAGRTPIQHCDHYVDAFKSLDKRCAVSFDGFQRTTDPYHELTAQRLWERCSAKGDIYLDAYEGWYNEREEVFVPEAEAEASQFCDPGSGVPLKRVKEESYFFKMSKYCDQLIAYIEQSPNFVEPEQYRNNILARLKKEGLRDLSISRTSFKWGIPMPKGFDDRHVMYVWFDALSNYLTGVEALHDESVDGKPATKKDYWPAACHVIGKDIIWFHCVIWPCMLMSAELPLPGGVFSHGFVSAADGRKMSKTYGNVVDPNEVLDKMPLDTLRYYLCASTTYGADCNFSEPTLIMMHNSELADILGNLVHRALNLCLKYCDGKIPESTHDAAFPLPFDLEALKTGVLADAKACAIHSAIFKGMEAARATNKYLTDAEPWKMKGVDEARRPAIVRTTLEAIYAFAHVLAPVMPVCTEQIFNRLSTPPVILKHLKNDFYNLKPGATVTLGEILFQKMEMPGENGDAAGNPAEKPAKAAKAAPAPKAKKEAEAPDDPNQPVISKIDLKVGKIVKVWNHEVADKLFCEEIDVGTGTNMQVASGLRHVYTLDEMQDRLVVVVCNLKEAKLAGFPSQGMVLASKTADGSKTELIDPPEGSKPGDRVLPAGVEGNPSSANRVKKLKLWEACSQDLATDDNSVACWQGKPLTTPAGEVKVKSVTSAPIN